MPSVGAAAMRRRSSMTTALLATCLYSCAGAASDDARASRQHVLAAGHAATQSSWPRVSKAATTGSVTKSESSCVPGVSAAYPPGTHDIHIDVDGTTRRFLLKVPFNVNASDGLPALVSLHGRTGNPWYFDVTVQQTGWYNEDRYDEDDDLSTPDNPAHRGYKWLIALPFGTAPLEADPTCCANKTIAECAVSRADDDNPCGWNAGENKQENIDADDVGFFRALAGWLKSEMCATDVFANGMSLGSSMSGRIGCELAGHYKGVAMFEGPFLFGNGFEKCEPNEPVSVVQFCGTDDGNCNDVIQTDVQTWAEANGCNSTAPTVGTYMSKTTHCQRFTGCPSDSFVEWCIIDDMPHKYVGHTYLGDEPTQAATNVDGMVYMMDRFSSIARNGATASRATRR